MTASRFAPLVGLALVAGLTGCPDTGIVCLTGTVRCGSSCVDPSADKRNCGACGQACGTDQACVPSTERIGVCVDATGGCGGACQSGQVCRAGVCTFELVAACFSSGQVTGFSRAEVRGPATSLGTSPAALAVINGTLLAADGTDQRLYQATQGVSGTEFAQRTWANRVGGVPTQVLVEGSSVFVVNASSGTLQQLTVGAPSDAGDVLGLDAGVTGGVPLATVAELPFGMNTYPEGVARLGGSLWVPLYGGYGAGPAAVGQKLARVSTADGGLFVADVVDLSTVNLHAFDGGTPVARPWAVTAHQGALYVALNNLDPQTYQPGGPGLLARVDPTSLAVTTIDLGAGRCLNPQWLASDGTHLVVSCGGQASYDSNYQLLGTTASGLVLLENDAVVASWAPGCAGGDAGCAPVLPGRFALDQGRVYLADQNAGRVFVFDVTDAGFGERRGYAGDAGLPVQACAVDAVTGIANVSDVVVLP